MSLRAIIVDDEELARSVIREFCGHHPEIEIIAECANGFDAVRAVTELKPDLMFLDIQMPKLDGFEVLELVGEAPAVIFFTAHDQYALRAFEAHAVDYLLKPFNAVRFDAALQRAVQRRREAAPAPDATALAAAARPSGQPLNRIVVRYGVKVTLVPVDKLDYVEAQDDYVSLVAEGKQHLKRQTIASLESGLDPARFVRIHRGYIVNLERVAKIEPAGKDSFIAMLISGAKLPVSRAGYARLRDRLR